MTESTSIRATREARDGFKALTAIMSGIAERPVTMSEAIELSTRITRRHLDEVRERLAPPPPTPAPLLRPPLPPAPGLEEDDGSWLYDTDDEDDGSDLGVES